MIDLKVWCNLALFISVRGWLNALTGLRIGGCPRAGDMCDGSNTTPMYPSVSDVRAVRDESNDSHLPATDGARQREHLVDTGHQHRPHLVHWSSLSLRMLILVAGIAVLQKGLTLTHPK
jgi:hypothetical protein